MAQAISLSEHGHWTDTDEPTDTHTVTDAANHPTYILATSGARN